MSATEADIQSVIVDRGESIALLDPPRIPEGSRHRPELLDVATELVRRASRLRGSLPAPLLSAIADLVRSMNCYYSNLIEGHDTHPIDIERALNNDFSHDPRQRNLQLEAHAHIQVQQWIDDFGLKGRATTVAGLCEIHSRFCDLLPPELLIAEDPDSGERVAVRPGQLRHRDVRVGDHVPVSPGAIPRFLSHFEQAYTRLGTTEAILATAAAHHRILWIHPFLDGNGRVARLMSHAMLLELLDTGGVWSIARGLSRQSDRYKQLLANCDLPRRNDLDGRGHLSEEALAAFTRFFLETCIDQVDFMERLMEPAHLAARVELWGATRVRVGQLPPKSVAVLQAALIRGEVPRGAVASIIGGSERTGRRIVAALLDSGALVSDSPRAQLRLAFPARLAEEWLPGLFPRR